MSLCFITCCVDLDVSLTDSTVSVSVGSQDRSLIIHSLACTQGRDVMSFSLKVESILSLEYWSAQPLNSGPSLNRWRRGFGDASAKILDWIYVRMLEEHTTMITICSGDWTKVIWSRFHVLTGTSDGWRRCFIRVIVVPGPPLTQLIIGTPVEVFLYFVNDFKDFKDIIKY